MNLSNKKLTLVYLEQYLPRKHQRLYGTKMSILYKMGENHCNNSPFFGAGAISYYSVFTQTLNMSNV